MNALLAIDRLRVHLGATRVLDEVSFDLGAGEVLGLVGESGSGKSMTALSVIGLLPEQARAEGSIRLDGDELLTKTEAQRCVLRGRDIGLVFQEPMTALNPLMTIGAQVLETVRLHRGVSRDKAAAIAHTALARVGLPAQVLPHERYPHELSGGQRQRVAIAIAIVLAPKLLIADEPTTALDPTIQAQILALLVALAREDGAGLVLITHDLALVGRYCDRVVVLKDGQVVEQGSTATVIGAPTHAYTQRLLADSAYAAKPAPRDLAQAPWALEVTDLVREYAQPRRHWFAPRPRVRALDGVTLQLRAGERVGLVGESGSGKSTLLRTIVALDAAQGGSVRLHGEPFAPVRGADLRRQRRRIQVVFQDPFGSFDPHWRVERVIAEPFHLLDDPPDAATRRRKVEAVLECVGLRAADADKFPHEFSGGQRQRIAIARALIIEPEIIVFDEAVSALDVTVRAQVLDLLGTIARQRTLAYLFVSHDLAVVGAVTDRVYVLQAGRIVEHGPTADVFGAPRHPYTAQLLAAMPRRLGAGSVAGADPGPDLDANPGADHEAPRSSSIAPAPSVD